MTTYWVIVVLCKYLKQKSFEVIGGIIEVIGSILEVVMLGLLGLRVRISVQDEFQGISSYFQCVVLCTNSSRKIRLRARRDFAFQEWL